jgi:RNA polymerase-associated protein CTR9
MFLASLYMQKARDAPKAAPGSMSPRRNELKAASSRTQTKESLQQLAVGAINEAARINQTSILTLLTTGIQRLATAGNDKTVTDQILRLFEEVLKTNPNNVIALIGKARVHYGRNQFSIALRLYQKALMARPDMQPDPRIGIGQCFWHLKMKSDAFAAWERALELVLPFKKPG